MADPPISNGNNATDAELEAYLDEALPPARAAEVEAALRSGDASLCERVGAIVSQRDAGMHSLGAVWRRRRLTCPSREELGSHLLGVLPGGEEGLAGYVRFHLEEVACPWCLANLADLREQAESVDAEPIGARRGRYFESSVGRLSNG